MDDASELKEAAKLYCEAMAFFLPAIECKLIASVLIVIPDLSYFYLIKVLMRLFGLQMRKIQR